jgi:hypothetical protein
LGGSCGTTEPEAIIANTEGKLRAIEYEHSVGPGSIVRVRFAKEAGHILSFMVQLECQFDDQWQPVIRYDTAHDYAHRDVLHPGGEVTKEDLGIADYNEALTFAQHDLQANWLLYRERHERWLKSQ